MDNGVVYIVGTVLSLLACVVVEIWLTPVGRQASVTVTEVKPVALPAPIVDELIISSAIATRHERTQAAMARTQEYWSDNKVGLFTDQLIAKDFANEDAWVEVRKDVRKQIDAYPHAKQQVASVHRSDVGPKMNMNMHEQACKLLREQPGMTVRALAAELKISVGKAHKLRKQCQ